MRTIPFFLVLFLLGCSGGEEPASATPEPAAAEPAAEVAATDPLADVLSAQPEDVQARYQYRNPAETLEFFGVEPGMTVMEALPGGGWYTKILMQYLGTEGTLLAANYSLELYPLFGFASEEFLERQAGWQAGWAETSADWGDASTSAFHLGSMPGELAGSADVVFFARALHNLARFELTGEGPFMTDALADAYAVLKPGGVLGVVQHSVSEEMSDDWANGSRGYLKKSYVIETIEAAGFEFVGESDINENPADQPGEEDFVWRLPPSLSGSGDDPERRAAMMEIGESNRMTLKFIKPAE